LSQFREAATSAILEITAELEAQSSAGLPLGDTIRGSVADIMLANGRLQEQLVAAEARLAQQAQEIQHQAAFARTDALTGLCNRRGFDDEFNRRLAEWMRRQSVFSLLLIDVDKFKDFNDLHGHQGGDEVLRAVAGLLARTFRDMDLLARYGGEEFAVILPATHLEDAIRVAQRARSSVCETSFSLGGKNLQLTVSAGVAQVVPLGATDVISRADEALYAAKAAGRNCVFFHDGEDCRAAEDPQPIASICAATTFTPGQFNRGQLEGL
jgi:diguanylate cyclase